MSPDFSLRDLSIYPLPRTPSFSARRVRLREFSTSEYSAPSSLATRIMPYDENRPLPEIFPKIGFLRGPFSVLDSKKRAAISESTELASEAPENEFGAPSCILFGSVDITA